MFRGKYKVWACLCTHHILFTEGDFHLLDRCTRKLLATQSTELENPFFSKKNRWEGKMELTISSLLGRRTAAACEGNRRLQVLWDRGGNDSERWSPEVTVFFSMVSALQPMHNKKQRIKIVITFVSYTSTAYAHDEFRMSEVDFHLPYKLSLLPTTSLICWTGKRKAVIHAC
jgi:hypothetical protein